MTESDKAVMQQALDVLTELQGSMKLYNKNGPDWTHKDGTEVFEVSVLMDRQEAIDIAVVILDAAIAQPEQTDVSDEAVEILAREMERHKTQEFEWTPEQFDIWWTKDACCKPEKLRDTARAGLTALHAAIAQPEQPAAVGKVMAPHYRGYASLGCGQYILNNTADFPAELIISIATDEETSGRAVGDSRNLEPRNILHSEDMVVQLRFENVAGLDALEQQLRFLREDLFPESIVGTK